MDNYACSQYFPTVLQICSRAENKVFLWRKFYRSVVFQKILLANSLLHIWFKTIPKYAYLSLFWPLTEEVRCQILDIEAWFSPGPVTVSPMFSRWFVVLLYHSWAIQQQWNSWLVITLALGPIHTTGHKFGSIQRKDVYIINTSTVLTMMT